MKVLLISLSALFSVGVLFLHDFVWQILSDEEIEAMTHTALLVVIWFYGHSHQEADSTFLPCVYADFARPLQKCTSFKGLGARGSDLSDPTMHKNNKWWLFPATNNEICYTISHSNKLHLDLSSMVTYIDNFCNFSSCNLQCFSPSIFHTHQFCGVYFLMLCNLWLESQWVHRGWVNIIQ